MPECKLLAQTHDSVTFQVLDNPRADDLVEEALERIRVELMSPSGRSYIVPGEATVGWNWGKANEKNPDGLAKFKRGDTRARTQLLARIMPS